MLVKVTLSAEIVVQSDHIWRATVIQKPVQLCFLNTRPAEVVPHAMRAIYASAKKVVGGPATFVFEIGLVRQSRRAVDLSEIVGLDEASHWIDPANRLH